MAINVTNQTAIPPGVHTGVITNARETTKTFSPQQGPEEVVEIIITPDYKPADGGDVLDVAVVYTPVLNGLSALSGLLSRLGLEPEAGKAWTPAPLVGTPVAFVAYQSDTGFIRVKKASITRA